MLLRPPLPGCCRGWALPALLSGPPLVGALPLPGWRCSASTVGRPAGASSDPSPSQRLPAASPPADELLADASRSPEPAPAPLLARDACSCCCVRRYMRIPPATATLILSMPPAAGMLTGVHSASASRDRPDPSLPSASHAWASRPLRFDSARSSDPSPARGSAARRSRPESSCEAQRRGRLSGLVEFRVQGLAVCVLKSNWMPGALAPSAGGEGPTTVPKAGARTMTPSRPEEPARDTKETDTAQAVSLTQASLESGAVVKGVGYTFGCTLSLKGSQHPGMRHTASQRKAAAVLKSVPRFPGSCTPSRTRTLDAADACAGHKSRSYTSPLRKTARRSDAAENH